MFLLYFFMEKSFFNRCYKLVSQIPRGKVSTYKAVAEKLGCKAFRAVGNAMNKNPFAPKVPCHRVVNSNGGVGGFALGRDKKIDLLRKEGVVVKDGRVDLDVFGHFFK